MAEPPDLSDLHALAREYLESFARSNAPLPQEFPEAQMRGIGGQLANLDGAGSEDTQRALVYAHAKLREARKVLRINAHDPAAPGYFGVERAHNDLFAELDALVAALPPPTLVELRPSPNQGALVVRRAELAPQVEALQRRVEAVEAQSRAALDRAAEHRTVVTLVYVESLQIQIGNLVKVVTTLSAELRASLIDLPWLAELSGRIGEVAAALGRAVEAARRGAGQLADLIAGADKARRLAERVVAGGRTILKWVKRALRPGAELRADLTMFRDVEEPWCPELVVIPAGEFLMGAPEHEEGSSHEERPLHEVSVRRFALGRYTVTFDEYDAFCAATGHRTPDDGGWGRRRMPAVDVSWDDAIAYCAWLCERTGQAYRLPSEAEWEYACRAGTTTPFWTGATISTDQANYHGSHVYGKGRKGVYREKTVAVDDPGFAANGFGLSHMHGNVWEWCEDAWHEDYAGAPSDGSAWADEDPTRRVLRGGSWIDDPRDLRSADRFRSAPVIRVDDAGFRVARTITP